MGLSWCLARYSRSWLARGTAGAIAWQVGHTLAIIHPEVIASIAGVWNWTHLRPYMRSTACPTPTLRRVHHHVRLANVLRFCHDDRLLL